LSVFKLVERGGFFSFGEHLEQVADWSDSLIVDVGPNDAGTRLQAWAAWNSQVAGPNDELDPITEGLPADKRDPISFDTTEGMRSCDIGLPTVAQGLQILGPRAHITIQVTDRTSPVAAVSG
jgi:hypothetical protein